MSVTDIYSKTEYVSKGENSFVIDFEFLGNEFITVFITPKNSDKKIEKVYGKDFSVENNQVVFPESIPAGSIVSIQRLTDITNETEFFNNTKLPANTLNYAFDKLTMICQELDLRLDNTLRYEGDGEIDFTVLAEQLKHIQDYIQNAEQLSESVVNAALSAAQALSAALLSRQFRDEAEKFRDDAKQVSDIGIHNQSESAHADIRNLISELSNILNTTSGNLSKLTADNNAAHEEFDTGINDLSVRLGKVEASAGTEAKAENKYYVFGRNNNGQCGVNWNENITAAPLAHMAMRNVAKVHIDSDNGVAISDGRIWVTGSGANGLCGPERQTCYGFKPLAMTDNIYNWIDIVCFGQTALALNDKGEVYSWGNGGGGYLGDGTTQDRSEPRLVPIDEKITKLAAGEGVILALSQNGNVYSLGKSSYGAMGSGIATTTHSTFTKITTLSDIVDIAAGGYTHTATAFPGTTSTSERAFCAAIQEKEGTKHLFVWGYNGNGQLGTGDKTNVAAPVELALSFAPVNVACGAAHMAVLSQEGYWYITGYQKGLGLTADQIKFVLVDNSRAYAEVACGRDVSYALSVADKISKISKIYAVGTNTYGSMLTENSTSEPILLVNDLRIKQIFASGDCYGCAFTVAEGAVAEGDE